MSGWGFLMLGFYILHLAIAWHHGLHIILCSALSRRHRLHNRYRSPPRGLRG